MTIIKASKRGRGEGYIADYYDRWGIRRVRKFRTKDLAEAHLATETVEGRQRSRPLVDPNISFESYARRFLDAAAVALKPQSMRSYRSILEVHFVPALGKQKLLEITRPVLKAFLVEKIKSGLKPATVAHLLAVVRALFSSAVEEQILLANPVAALGRVLKLRTYDPEEIKALDADQLQTFLATVRTEKSLAPYHPAFVVMAYSGLRMGEALALQWADLDFERRAIHVRRQITEQGVSASTKSGKARIVDMALVVRDVLLGLPRTAGPSPKVVSINGDSPLGGTPEASSTPAPWLLCPGLAEAPSPREAQAARERASRAFGRALRLAGLPRHFSPHSLRHSFASLLLQQGESPAYVQAQLGHSSIKLTCDLYGKWLPMGNPAALDRLAARTGSKPVAAEAKALMHNERQEIFYSEGGSDLHPQDPLKQTAAKDSDSEGN
jgi:integrase